MTDTKKPDQKTERVIFALTPGELERIDDWRYGARIPSRSEAIRELIRRGMAAPDKKKP